MFAFSLLLSLMLLWAVSLGKHASSLWLVSVSRKGTAAPRQRGFSSLCPLYSLPFDQVSVRGHGGIPLGDGTSLSQWP